mmetsp:Transcript_32462/g.92507  ORF Transcript_32462/g.92507 Transcript_32462/m.92507 type:complete len:295 (+) Transcript_32462:55-939(+)
MATKLSTGGSMPSVAFGFWQVPGDKCSEVLEAAIDAGFRCLDCAAIYGNEAEVGEALSKVFASGKVRREDLFVVSKLWATDWHQVGAACDKSLRDLKLDYVDLYLVHSAVGVDASAGLDALGRKVRAKVPVHKLWQDMEALVRTGKAKSIGVSNWSCLQIADLMLYAEIPPAVNQLEIHPTFSCEELAQWCLSEGIAVMGYCTLGSGKPDMTSELVLQAAKRLNVSSAQILMRWSQQKGYIPVTKSMSLERMRTNLSLGFELSAEEMKALDGLDGGLPMKICNHAGEFGLPLYS